jgi:hypothetical protein
MNMNKILLLAAFAALSCHAIQGQTASQPRVISGDEASAFELALLARESNSPKAPEKLYIQPANKAEACKLPTSQSQLDRPNIRAYWDGECKNGFAFGLGRDIAISDTHHIEEITIHDGTGDDWSQPRVDYDYVNNIVSYAVGGSTFPTQTSLSERMVDSISGFNAYQTLSVVDKLGKAYVVQSSAFQPQRTLWNSRTDGAISYRFTDNSAAPVTNQNAAIFAAEIIDPKSNTVGGVAVVHYANGATRHFKVSNEKKEIVSPPTTYTDHLQAIYQEVVNVTSRASTNLERAQQIEREYLYKACNGKSSIKGLDNSDYTKICTWRDQFKEPYAIASANYQRQLESLRQQATTAEQQRQIQQQIAQQQQMLQQQRNQQAWNEANQANQQLQQQTQQILDQASQQLQQQGRQGVNSWQAPQVQPLTPSSRSTVICQTIGSITTCR